MFNSILVLIFGHQILACGRKLPTAPKNLRDVQKKQINEFNRII